jgi:hypothetical protein
MSITVHHYGVHASGEFVFLHEKGHSVCLNDGFETLTSPFVVTPPPPSRSLNCPHTFLSGVEELIAARVPPYEGNELIYAMAPAPGETRTYWVPPELRNVIEQLTMLSSLGPSSVVAPWRNHWLEAAAPSLLASNIGPVVVVAYDTASFRDIARMLQLPRTRPILFCGAMRPPGAHMSLLAPSADINRAPLRSIGWTILKRHAAVMAREARRAEKRA